MKLGLADSQGHRFLTLPDLNWDCFFSSSPAAAISPSERVMGGDQGLGQPESDREKLHFSLGLPGLPTLDEGAVGAHGEKPLCL